jgi:hypothetical protein
MVTWAGSVAGGGHFHLHNELTRATEGQNKMPATTLYVSRDDYSSLFSNKKSVLADLVYFYRIRI